MKYELLRLQLKLKLKRRNLRNKSHNPGKLRNKPKLKTAGSINADSAALGAPVRLTCRSIFSPRYHPQRWRQYYRLLLYVVFSAALPSTESVHPLSRTALRAVDKARPRQIRPLRALGSEPYVGSDFEIIDPSRFLAGCRERQLSHVLSLL